MFSIEYDGYNKKEVDDYIARLKAEHEGKLMEEKLKVLESENKLLDFRKKSYELENREKNIMSALDAFRRYQDEGTKNIASLRLKQISMFYQEFLLVIQELSLQYKGIERNNALVKLKNSLDSVVNDIEEKNEDITTKANTENDSMRILLNKMQGYRKSQDAPREVKITRQNDNQETLSLSKPNESGFDLKEAINPKEDLAEIMKAFDFFDGDK